MSLRTNWPYKSGRALMKFSTSSQPQIGSPCQRAQFRQTWCPSAATHSTGTVRTLARDTRLCCSPRADRRRDRALDHPQPDIRATAQSRIYHHPGAADSRGAPRKRRRNLAHSPSHAWVPRRVPRSSLLQGQARARRRHRSKGCTSVLRDWPDTTGVTSCLTSLKKAA
jgi:hypothetical protein